MFSIYVLRSLKNHKRYVGQTGQDVLIRLREHNLGSNAFTRQNGPFKLIHSEEYLTRTEAIRREKFLKTGKGREYLDKILKN